MARGLVRITWWRQAQVKQAQQAQAMKPTQPAAAAPPTLHAAACRAQESPKS